MSTTRREFLEAGLGATAALSLGAAAPAWLSRAARALPPRATGATALVVLQLSGGNDGLNTLVPFEDDAYARSRPTLRLPSGELHRIADGLAFHPRMGAFARLFAEGHLGVVQSVGFEGSSRSHGPAMAAWQTADLQDPERRTGWIGRLADRELAAAPDALPALFVGTSARPLAVNAAAGFVPTVGAARELVLPGDASEPASGAAGSAPLQAHLRRTQVRASAASRRLAKVLAAQGAAGSYPDFGLAARLRTIAQLVRADLGVRVFFTELGGDGFGGFDNHANQLGNHCALLHQLSESVGAFIADLARDGLHERVLLMSFSEFGRTLAENGRRGTGHGAAAPVFLAGGKLKGGLAGERPDLSALDQGAPRVQIDFRRLYATVIERWLGLDSRAVLGADFDPLELFDA